jgi:hypothetical protein
MKSKEEEDEAAVKSSENLGKWSIQRVQANEPQSAGPGLPCPNCERWQHTAKTWQQTAEDWQQAATKFQEVAEQNRQTAETWQRTAETWQSTAEEWRRKATE